MSQTKAQILYAGSILGILNSDYVSWTHSGVDSETVERLVREREQARTDRDWALADALRAQLTDMGVTLEDGPQGTQWRRA
jgi:cysteinyl-tRNA synthetase